MRRKYGIVDFIVWGLLVVAALLPCLSFSIGGGVNAPEKAAGRMSKSVGKRMAVLETYVHSALTADKSQWGKRDDVPEDMVIYRYFEDSLQSWSNQFPVINDDISSKLIFPRLSRPQRGMDSPLATIGEEPSFRNYGSKWYLVKSERLGARKVVAGLLICDSMNEGSASGVNPRLSLRNNYSIMPLSSSGGTAVTLEGKPVFKVANETMRKDSILTHSTLIWLALFVFILASMLHLNQKRTLRRLAFVSIALFMVLSATYLWGLNIRNYSKLFSPTVYANGQFSNSLGALLLLSVSISLFVFCLYMTRRSVFRKVLASGNPRLAMHVCSGMIILGIAGLAAYVYFIIKSVVVNSSVCLELYKISELNYYTLLVYVMIIAVTMTLPLLSKMLTQLWKRLYGLRHEIFSKIGMLALAGLFGAAVVMITSVLGFRKERDMAGIWANQLSIDRNIGLELMLRENEEQIANDLLIAYLSGLENVNNIILNRIVETYFFRVARNNDVYVELFNEGSMDKKNIEYFNNIIASGDRIDKASRFLYLKDESGHTIYTGNFVFYSKERGVTDMLLTVSPKSNREDRGYARLLGYSAPGEVLIPLKYSYGKYVDDKLITYKGNYSYPTVIDVDLEEDLLNASSGVLKVDGYTHFVNRVSDDDYVLVSRTTHDMFNYLVEFLFLSLVMYLCLYAVSLTYKGSKRPKEKSYFKSRINTATMLTLVMTLIALGSVSVIFVYNRNITNLRSSITEKANAIQTLLQTHCRFTQSYRDLESQEAAATLDDISNTMKADISLYTPDGKLFRSTTPEIMDRMLLGMRMNQKAFDKIAVKYKRYCVNKEKVGNVSTYMLYAPIFNTQGKLIAIMGSPYTDDSYDFLAAAFLHIATILTVFLILLMLARFIMSRTVNKMFKPVSEMSGKMNRASIDNLEYIVYEQEDEVSNLVRAYNLMVHDLHESSKRQTQAERDRAWATMARQVAHEIKNPLTPIKLQIQRLIRMKKNGNPAWQDRFDEVTAEILRQIDLLADTANEFSTFAKLYTEEPVEIDLDKLLKEEIDLFDTHDDIKLSYIGLNKATVVGPKPQLTRVFTNLIGNSVQAIEGVQNEAREKGEPRFMGRILVSLRLSGKDGYYDIVVEDNGPGVSEENRERLFTPNFTTKSNGTGLGLSICRNILEKCDGEIHYSRSFSLGGACFTVRFPMPKA